MKRRNSILRGLAIVLLGFLGASCRAPYYRKSADNEVYKIIQGKQKDVFGKTNSFTIDTRYSNREAADIKSKEIFEDRSQTAKQVLPLTDALRIAIENNRQYQLRKENLYLAALTLTRERYAFTPQLFAGSTASGERAANGEKSTHVNSRAGVNQLLKTGGTIGLSIANDLLRFYTGDPRRTAVSTISLNLVQPLMRGAGAEIAAENLTQAERNVIYEIRSFSHYQNTFALDTVSSYFRLLQQQDTVRNEYNNYLSAVKLREQAEALGVDRLPPIQVDQALQSELSARSRYILAVERYQSTLDQFKITLGLPLGYEIRLDDKALKEIEDLGLVPVPMAETDAYRIALDYRLDLLNEIDAFEDAKRKIKITVNRLKPDLNLFGDASLQSEHPTDYAKFNLNDYRISGGVQLDLPINRLLERNAYRSALLSFERQIRSLALFLDTVRDSVREGNRTLEQTRQSFEIQKNARDLADRRVESAELSLQAGRAQTRDVLEAQNSRVSAYNAATQALVDYHLSRLRLLLDMGVLKTEIDKFWLRKDFIPKSPSEVVAAPAPSQTSELITPEQLFEK